MGVIASGSRPRRPAAAGQVRAGGAGRRRAPRWPVRAGARRGGSAAVACGRLVEDALGVRVGGFEGRRRWRSLRRRCGLRGADAGSGSGVQLSSGAVGRRWAAVLVGADLLQPIAIARAEPTAAVLPRRWPLPRGRAAKVGAGSATIRSVRPSSMQL